MQLSVVIPVLNQHELAKVCIRSLQQNSTTDPEIIVIDDGSDLPFYYPGIDIIRNEKCSGSYSHFADEYYTGDIVAFIHSDLIIHEKGWDERVIKAFENDEKLGLIGFIGSNEIDGLGGRGLGTMSNFAGYNIAIPERIDLNGFEGIVTVAPEINNILGSPAEIHGKRVTGLEPAVVLDGCSMIFRKEALQKITHDFAFPPHHFYDRMMSIQMIQAGYKDAVIGILCDHLSGQTVNHESKYHDMCKQWCKNNLGIDEPGQWVTVDQEWFNNPTNASRGNIPTAWDHVIYMEAERRFMKHWRDGIHVIPIKI